MNKEEIMQILPHREGMLLIDEATLLREGEAQARYTVRGDEWFLQGHFPGRPVVPGVIQVEMLAQTGGLAVMTRPEFKGCLPVLAGIKNARFKRMILPGDVLTIRCRIDRIMLRMGQGSGKIYVGDELALTAEVAFSILPQ